MRIWILIVGLSIFLIVNIILLVVVIKLIWWCTVPNTIRARIVGGVPVDIKYYQFMAAIVEKREESTVDVLVCGATILSRKWLVSAAHCVKYIEDGEREFAYISTGHSDWRKGNRHNLLDWTYHEDFNENTLDNDIGLIRVEHSLNKKFKKDLGISSINYKYKPGTKVRIIGWGHIDVSQIDQPAFEKLHAADVYIIEQSRCINLYKRFGLIVTNTMFCAGTKEGGKDACKYDSGGAIFEQDLLIGLISWGRMCAIKDQPGVYVRINLYKKWIIEATLKLGSPLYIQKKSTAE